MRGEGKIYGSPTTLRLTKATFTNNCEVKVDYTNVKLPCAWRWNWNNARSDPVFGYCHSFVNQVRGCAQARGYVNGNIFHTNFSRMQIDYDVTYHNMLVLNTTEKREQHVLRTCLWQQQHGYLRLLNKLHMQVRDTTTAGSRFILPLDGPAEVSEDDFVKFVKKDTTKTPETPITRLWSWPQHFMPPQASRRLFWTNAMAICFRRRDVATLTCALIPSANLKCLATTTSPKEITFYAWKCDK